MPIDNSKPSTWFQDGGNGACESQLIRDAVKGIRHQNEVHWPTYEIGDGICIACDKLAVGNPRGGDFCTRGVKHLRIDVDRNGQVTSHLTVEKPETLSMLRQDAPQLQQALNDAGLKTNSSGLQFSLRDQSSSGQNNGNNNQPGAQPQRLIVSDEETVPSPVVGRSYGRAFGSSGGVDIRV